MTVANDSRKKRKLIAKKLDDMMVTVRDVLYTQEFPNDVINFEVKRSINKIGYIVRIDVTPYAMHLKPKDIDSGVTTV